MRSIPTSPLLAALLVSGLVVATAGACGGKTTVPAVLEDAAPPSDSGPGPRPADCPASLPAPDASCTKEGLLCEYGDDYNPLCNKVVECSVGRWAEPISHSGSARAKCPSTIPTVPPNPTDCASTRDTVPTGKACSTKSSCAFDGAICTCGVFCSNYPIRMPDCNPDAGVTTSCCDTTKIEWHCFDGPKYCAASRPRVGAACTKEGDACAIDEPAECGQTVLECQKGVWDLLNTTCPASSASVKRDIAYLDQAEAARLRKELLAVRLATYRYKTGDDAPHLGFIIEDMPSRSAAVLPSRDRVDLYGYVSMAVATLQQQDKDIASLKADVARLSAEIAAMKGPVHPHKE